jgi:hypothetical protein
MSQAGVNICNTERCHKCGGAIACGQLCWSQWSLSGRSQRLAHHDCKGLGRTMTCFCSTACRWRKEPRWSPFWTTGWTALEALAGRRGGGRGGSVAGLTSMLAQRAGLLKRRVGKPPSGDSCGL